MFFDLTTTLLIMAFIITAIIAFLAFTGKKNLFSSLLKGKAARSLQFSQAAAGGFPPPLIERPIIEFDDKTTISIEREAAVEPTFEMIDDEESVLLKAAEVVVEKVQDVISNVASNPPDPEEVTSKIRSIVHPYMIFHGTEYFDAINSFIAISVERDCNIKLTKDDLLALWN